MVMLLVPAHPDSPGQRAVKRVCVCDMLSVDGDADAAVEARNRIGWNKFRQLVPLLLRTCL